MSDTPQGDTKQAVARPEMLSRIKRLSSLIGGSVDSGFVDHTDHVAETRVPGGSFESDHSPDSLTSSSETIEQQTTVMKQTGGIEHKGFLKQTKESGENYSLKQTTHFPGMEFMDETMDTLSVKHVTRNIYLTEQSTTWDDKQTIDLSVVLSGYGGLQKKMTRDQDCGKLDRYLIKKADHHSGEQTTLDGTDEIAKQMRIQHVVATIETNGFPCDVTHGKNKQPKTPQFRAGVCTNNSQDECIKPTGNDISKEIQFQDLISGSSVQGEKTYFKRTQVGQSDHNMTNSESAIDVSAQRTKHKEQSSVAGSLKVEENDTKLFVEESTFRNEGGICFEEDDTIVAERVVKLSATPNGSIVGERESCIVAETVETMSCAPTHLPCFPFIDQPVTARVMLKWPFSNGRFLRAIDDTDKPVLIIDFFRRKFRSQYCFTSETKFALDGDDKVYYLKCFRYDFKGKSFYLAPELISGVCGTTMKFIFIRATREQVVESRLSLSNSKFWFNFKMPLFPVLQSLPFPDYYISLEKGARVLLRRTKDSKPDTRNFHIQIIPMQSHRQSSRSKSGLLSCFR